MKTKSTNAASARKSRSAKQQSEFDSLKAAAEFVREAELSPTSAKLTIYLGGATIRIEVATNDGR